MNKLSAMRAFVEIVDQGSLTGAAETLGKSLPTVVRTLATLEAALGVRLLRRTTRRSSLTPEGRDYLERCRRILADVEDAELALSAGQVEPRGELRVTAPVLFGQMHVAPAVVAFTKRHPKVSVDLTLLDRVVDLVDEGIDAAVRISPLPDSSMIAIGTGSVRRVVVASPALLERLGIPEHPDALGSLPCVRCSSLAPGDIWRFTEKGRELGIRVSGPFRCNQAEAALAACADGLGFGQFLSYQVAPLLRTGGVQLVLRDHAPPPIPVSLVYSDGRLVSTRLRAFLDWMRDALRARAEVES